MLFLCGPHGAGKTEASRVFSAHGFMIVDTGPLMRAQHALSGSPLDIGRWISNGEQRTPGFTHDVFLAAVKRPLAEAAEAGLEILMVGFRSLEDICVLLERATDPWERAVLINIAVSRTDVLRRRWVAREQQPMTRADFASLLQRDQLMGLGDIAPVADYTLQNDGTRKRFLTQVIDLCSNLLELPRQVYDQPRLQFATAAAI